MKYYPAYIEVEGDQLIATERATLTDWLNARQHETGSARKKEIEHVIKQARHRGVVVDEPLLPQLRL